MSLMGASFLVLDPPLATANSIASSMPCSLLRMCAKPLMMSRCPGVSANPTSHTARFSLPSLAVGRGTLSEDPVLDTVPCVQNPDPV